MTSLKLTAPRAGFGSLTGCVGALISGSAFKSSESRSEAPAARCRSPQVSLNAPTLPEERNADDEVARNAGSWMYASEPQAA